MILKAEVAGSSRSTINGIGLLEPSANQTELGKKGLLVARAVVTTNSESLPVRVFNATLKETTVKRGTMVARLSSVREIKTVDAEPGSSPGRKPGNQSESAVPPHLEDLHQRSIENIPEQYQESVAGLLSEFTDVFSSTQLTLVMQDQ